MMFWIGLGVGVVVGFILCIVFSALVLGASVYEKYKNDIERH